MGDKWCFIEYSTVGTRLGRVFFFAQRFGDGFLRGVHVPVYVCL